MLRKGRVAMEKTPDIQYFTQKCIRCGATTYSEIREFGKRYGSERGDLLIDELNTTGVRLIDERNILCSPQTNVLMNNLRLVELVSLALQLPVTAKICRKLSKNVLQRRTFELDLRRLDYLDSDNEWYYCSPSFNHFQQALRHLFDSGQIPFSKEWKNEKRRESHEYLRGLMAHPLFAERILSLIREHYLGLREVRLLIGWIKTTSKDAPVMVDIVQTALRQDGPDLVRGVLFSNQSSNADSALRYRKDVCFSCPPERRCLSIQNVETPITFWQNIVTQT